MHTRIAQWAAAHRLQVRIVLGSALVLVAALQAAALYKSAGWSTASSAYQIVNVDLSRPDVLVRTRSLSSFCRDVVKLPLARDLLGEDFAFYYESHPERLGLSGSLRRIAYEHDVTWTDRLVSSVFDEPADVLLWRGPKGALDYWAISMSRGLLATALQDAATIAGKDRQLTLAGTMAVDGTSVQVLALEYAPDRTVLIASLRDRVVVLSDPGMLGDGAGGLRGEPARTVAALLSADERKRGVYSAVFPSESTGSTHAVAASLRFISFGYQRFFPGVEAVKFEFGKGAWSTSMLLDPAALPGGTIQDAGLWNVVPGNAAACALLPVDWSYGTRLATRAVGAVTAPAVNLAEELDGPAAICWYADGQFHTPLVAATLKNPRGDLDPLLAAAFDWGIRKAQDAPAVIPKRSGEGEITWQREVAVPFTSVNPETGRPEPAPLRVTLAAKGRHLFFSPDGEQVARALATVAKRYPSLADLLPRDAVTLAIVDPKALASLGRKEAMVMLPPADEPVFRAAAEQHLFPRLDRLAAYSPFRLAFKGQQRRERGWERVSWEALAR